MAADLPPRALRCAIYTRKSSDEGLEQSFNSLHAQREACEAYVKSQAHEGWITLLQPYDDGGFSGGTMVRPALKALLRDIQAGLIDVVVVYKVDRLTRSLTDFAKILETFEDGGVSFVSITQAFNTTTSMGRLTLNVLLSFAQFEREVTGERIRDKIAQSKARGMWMGGNVLLGYDLKDRQLTINEAEAEQVRGIYRRYLELGSVNDLLCELQSQGALSKAWTSVAGSPLGGRSFSRGSLYYLLQNRHYLGEIVHKDQVYPGLHPAIVDPVLFEAVQASLAAGRRRRTRTRTAAAAKARLTGRIVDEAGEPMTPTFSVGKGGRIYRYYVKATLQSGGKSSSPLDRLPADAVETFVADQLRRIGGVDQHVRWETLSALLVRLEVRPTSVQFLIDAKALPGQADLVLMMQELQARLQPEELVSRTGNDHVLRVHIPVRLKLRGGRTFITAPLGEAAPETSANPKLVAGLRFAHDTLRRLGVSPLGGVGPAAYTRAPETVLMRRRVRPGFLAPDLQQKILEGRHPDGVTLTRLCADDFPILWEDQRRWWRSLG